MRKNIPKGHPYYCASEPCTTFFKKRFKHGQRWLERVRQERVIKLYLPTIDFKAKCPDCGDIMSGGGPKGIYR